jgi:hypothetical protein
MFSTLSAHTIPFSLINCVSRLHCHQLPGVIVYKDCKARLDHIRREHPHLFAQRSLYLQAHRMLESYTFKLNARRDILALFTDEARLKATE